MENFIFSASINLVFPGIPILLCFLLGNIMIKRKKAEFEGNKIKSFSKPDLFALSIKIAVLLIVIGKFIALVVLQGNPSFIELFFKSWLTILEVVFVLLFFEFCKRIYSRKSKK